MMYSEFIAISGKSESYISFKEYTDDIEPIYMGCELSSKQEFIRYFNKTFADLVYPVIENTISKLSTEDKIAYLYGERPDIENHIKLVDKQARQLVYQYMRLYLGL